MLKDNLEKLKSKLPVKNPFGEKVTLVAATKTQPVSLINEAIELGITDIGENKAQEFRDKFESVLPINYHFFGRLQKNKVKYLIGKACLIQSVDSISLAEEISRQSLNKNTITNILLEVNCGEEQKGGFELTEVLTAFNKIKNLPNICVKGLMAVLPRDKTPIIQKICLQIRAVYDTMRIENPLVSILSMGMTADFLVAIEAGSNMIRIGEAIFGKRYYSEEQADGTI